MTRLDCAPVRCELRWPVFCRVDEKNVRQPKGPSRGGSLRATLTPVARSLAERRGGEVEKMPMLKADMPILPLFLLNLSRTWPHLLSFFLLSPLSLSSLFHAIANTALFSDPRSYCFFVACFSLAHSTSSYHSSSSTSTPHPLVFLPALSFSFSLSLSQ